MYTNLISVPQLADILQDPSVVILDARFSLADSGRGERDYLKAHIPGALYVHLDHDLSAPVVKGTTGRHPLPGVDTAAARFGAIGIGDDTQVIVYDDAGGALAAVRAWWMLLWLGHQSAAVLDGGWQAWLSAGMDTSRVPVGRSPRQFTPQPRADLLVDTAFVELVRQDPGWYLGDARARERYLGQNETIDPVAGHIPGAHSIPYLENLNPEGFFRSPAELRDRYTALLQGIPAERTVFYCGSGVTSIHNILAMQAAGLGEARLYAGSWSEWIAEPTRPIAAG